MQTGLVVQLNRISDLPAAGRFRRFNGKIMIFVYVLRSQKNGHLYIGMTNNLERRLEEHNTGKNRSTKAYIPYKLLTFEKFKTRVEARLREKYLKSSVGRRFINANWPRSSTE